MKNKIKLLCKTIGLILLLLLGPSLFVLIFFKNYETFNLSNQVIINLICNIIILSILFLLYNKTITKDFKNFFKKENFLNNLEEAFKYWFLGFIIMLISNLIISMITNGGIASNEEQVRSLIDKAPLYMLFDVAIYAPLTEELIFRKSIKDFINNKWLYVLVSGLVFGGLHVVSSITSITDLLYLIPYSSLGIAFALLYKKSDNIFSSICMHSLHNTMAIILYIFLL